MRRPALALLALLLAPAAAADALDALFLDSAPCRNLPGLNRTDQAKVDAITITYGDGLLRLNGSGFLRCKTSDNAFFRSSASTRFTLAAEVDIDACTPRAVQVQLLDIRGTIGPFTDLLETQLEGSASRELIEACADLKD